MDCKIINIVSDRAFGQHLALITHGSETATVLLRRSLLSLQQLVHRLRGECLLNV